MERKNWITLLFAILLVAPLIMTSCSDDEDETVDPLVGTFTFSSATFGAQVTIQNIIDSDMDGIPDSPLTFNIDDDATQFVVDGLFDDSPCTPATGSAVEIRADGTIWTVCVGSATGTPVQFGTWSVNSARDQLTLNISVGGAPFALVMAGDFSATSVANTVQGTVSNYPLPVDALQDIGAGNLQTTTLILTFTRV